jgi:hypothetical protein
LVASFIHRQSPLLIWKVSSYLRRRVFWRIYYPATAFWSQDRRNRALTYARSASRCARSCRQDLAFLRCTLFAETGRNVPPGNRCKDRCNPASREIHSRSARRCSDEFWLPAAALIPSHIFDRDLAVTVGMFAFEDPCLSLAAVPCETFLVINPMGWVWIWIARRIRISFEDYVFS